MRSGRGDIDLMSLQVESAPVDGWPKLAAADLGLALYLTTLLADDPDAHVAFILLVAVLLGERCCFLMAATAPRR
jgi:hypothetical protein